MVLNGESVVNSSVIDTFFVYLRKNLNILFLDEKRNTVFNYLEDFFENLENAVYYYEYDNVDDYYMDLGLKKSSEYIARYDKFSDFMFKIGLGESSAYLENDKGQYSVYYGGLPCEGDFYDKLKETGDYWWFLVCFLQKLGSPASQWETREVDDIIDRIVELSKMDKSKFSLEWFLPLKSYITSKSIEDEYKNQSIDSIYKSSSDFNFDEIPEADLTDVPEFEIEDSYIEKNGKYYDPLDVYRAITASGGLAQALERQDLEDKVTTANMLYKKKKLGKKIKVKAK